MCLECSGKHRGLGVHLSFVRYTRQSYDLLCSMTVSTDGVQLAIRFFHSISPPADMLIREGLHACSNAALSGTTWLGSLS